MFQQQRYPLLTIDLGKIRDNTKYAISTATDLEVFGVTKGCAGAGPVAQAMIDGGVAGLADSRLLNLQNLRKCFPDLQLLSLRQPMIGEIREIVDLGANMMISDPAILPKLTAICDRLGRRQKVLVMIEVGDDREGLAPKDFLALAANIKKWPALDFVGIAANVGCCGSQTTSLAAIEILCDLANKSRSMGVNLDIVSAGNSSCWKLLKAGSIPRSANQLRLGELLLLGNETETNKPAVGFHQNACLLEAEVLEASVKQGEQQLIVAAGCQDIGRGSLKPLNKKMQLTRTTSDHAVLKSETNLNLNVGDVVTLIPSYFALQSLSASPHVRRDFIGYNNERVQLAIGNNQVF